MPEINSQKKVNKKKPEKSPSKHKPKSKSKNSSKSAISGAGIKWASREEVKEEQIVSKQQIYLGIAAIFIFFMFILWAFVDERPEWKRHAQQRDAERQHNESLAKQQERESQKAALLSYNSADLLNSTAFSHTLQIMQGGEDDRLIVVAFDDSTGDEAGGNVYKVRLFKKMDGIAKRIGNSKLFKRYEAEDIPRFVLFDCGSVADASAPSVCQQVVGENVPNVLVFRPSQQPRALPADLKSDRDIMTYLYRLMQPAVQYLDEVAAAEDFVADDSELHAMLFSKNSDVDAINVFDAVSDSLRDYGSFGRTRNPTVIEAFDIDYEAQLPLLLIWRTFGENPQIFGGNMTSAEAVRDFVINNYVPVLSEFSPQTSSRLMKRGLPILWVAYDTKVEEDALRVLLDSVLAIAKQYRGQLTFVQLDVDAQPQIAQNFGLSSSASAASAATAKKNGEDGEEDEDDDDEEDEEEDRQVPAVFIMNQMASVKEKVNMDDIEGTVQRVIDEYLLQLRIQRGDVMPELHQQAPLGDDDDDDFEDDDEDEEEEEEEDEDEEEDEEEEEEEDADTADTPKTDL